ncbi:MAG: SDR family NAD(P)-dependent oxidoreductase [Chromatiales bacterium]|jgi:short-subunit dehydrogenase|nr:SDR family NAD(P)-dependent oxidoreductase [Chromatiales bacterium]
MNQGTPKAGVVGTQCALVTGASSGIGEAIAREYARREDKLQRLADELRAQVPVEVVPADLSDSAAPAALVEEIHRRDLKVRILVNNAGYGVAGRYLANDWATHAAFLQVMIGAVSELTWRLLPDIRSSGNGRIINVASVAGLVPGADGQTLYAAVKSYLVKFSESLAVENKSHGVHGCALCPGFTQSEFHDVTGTRSMMNKLPNRFGCKRVSLPAQA